MSRFDYYPDPPPEPELSWRDENEIARNNRDIKRYQEQWDALNTKNLSEFTDEDSVQMDVLERWISEAEMENGLILSRYGLTA